MISATRSQFLGALLVACACISGVPARAQQQQQQPAGDPAAAQPRPQTSPATAAPAGASQSAAPDFSALAGDSKTNYRISPGDVVEIRVLGEDQMGTTARVSNTGHVRVPFAGDDVRAQCLTERQLASVIAERLKKYLKYPEVYVSVKEYNGVPIAVIGAVGSPGRFQVQRKVSLLELLVLAGGANDKAGGTINVIHTTEGDPCDAASAPAVDADNALAAERVSVRQLMSGDPSANPTMRPGDIVIVPSADLVFIAGEVFKPNAYTLREGLSLTQLMALSGGPTNVAKTDKIRIVRTEPGKPRVEIPVNLKDIKNNKADDPLLLANDVVEVPSSTGKKIFTGFISTVSGTVGQLPVRVIP